MKINEVIMRETATAGATSAGNIAAVVSPHVAINPIQEHQDDQALKLLDYLK